MNNNETFNELANNSYFNSFMKLLLHAEKFTNFASIMFDAISCLLHTKLCWHNRYKPTIYTQLCISAIILVIDSFPSRYSASYLKYYKIKSIASSVKYLQLFYMSLHSTLLCVYRGRFSQT